MNFEKLTTKDHAAFLKLYDGSFPDNERRIYTDADDLASFMKSKGAKFHAFALKDDRELVGFLSYWDFEGYTYIEHLAVDPAHRGKGLGSKMLQHLFDTVNKNVLIEVERPETDEARRRLEFYERNGFKTRREIDYRQPAYSKKQEPVEMLLMTHGDVELKGYDSIREMLHEVYNVDTMELQK